MEIKVEKYHSNRKDVFSKRWFLFWRRFDFLIRISVQKKIK